MSLQPGPILPKNMDSRQHARWCREQTTADPSDVDAAIAVHTASADNTTAAALVAAIATHTASTDNVTAAELVTAIANHTASADNATDAEVATAVAAEASARNSAISAAIAALNLASGVYTPTLTSVSNVDSTTAFQCQYLRVGSVVSVSGVALIDPTAAADTQVGVSLPIASNFGAIEDCAGSGAALSALWAVAIYADATNNRAEIRFIAPDTTGRNVYLSFQYRII